MSLYDDLGVQPAADPDTIKRSYRKLSKEHHPDAGGKEEDFLRICKAYEVLSDPERRKKYDETGDSSEPRDAVQDKAMQLLSRAFDHVITRGTGNAIVVDELRYIDLPAEMRRVLSDDVRLVTETIEAGAKLRIVMVDMYARVEKAPEKDPFGEIVAQRIQVVDNQIKRAEFQKSALTRAMTMLEGYAYRVDPRRAPSSIIRGSFMDVQALRDMGLFTPDIEDEDEDEDEEEDKEEIG